MYTAFLVLRLPIFKKKPTFSIKDHFEILFGSSNETLFLYVPRSQQKINGNVYEEELGNKSHKTHILQSLYGPNLVGKRTDNKMI